MTTEPSKLRKTVSFVLLAAGLELLGVGFGVMGALVIGRGIGGDSFSVLLRGILATVVGYPVGIVIGLVLVKHFLRRKGSPLLGSIACVLWMVIGYLAAMLLAQADINPYISLIFCFVTVPVVALAGFFLKR